MNKDAMWQAVRARDTRFDGEFFYGVLTTGVFCRPSCPSRQALRKNVRFYATAVAASKDGLRPCKRCKPLESTAKTPTLENLLALCRFIDAHPEEELTLNALCRRVGLSTFQVHRMFKAFLTVTPKEYIEQARLAALKRNLRSAPSVTHAIYDAGFGSVSVIYGRLDRQLGMTPKKYRSGGAGVSISFAIGDTALGRVLIGATDRGVCYLQFGDSDGELLEQLAREYPQAEIAPMPETTRGQFDDWMSALGSHLTGATPRLDLPLDIRGTAFQRKVWDFLRCIPYGDVMSYTEVAQAINAPTAARAVANACAKNRIGLLIPCHRVIRGDGTLGGYRWGTARKRTLIDVERRHRAGTEPEQ
ncbi:MAG: bifunctional DNA-binding transcriptional regulator/O6-methylguanine-DNA methyltransferase Ada [Gammaproteobacteria bacterium]